MEDESTSDLSFPELDMPVAEIVAKYVIAERERAAKVAEEFGAEEAAHRCQSCALEIAEKIRSGE